MQACVSRVDTDSCVQRVDMILLIEYELVCLSELTTQSLNLCQHIFAGRECADGRRAVCLVRAGR
jgi:hypothetical protein